MTTLAADINVDLEQALQARCGRVCAVFFLTHILNNFQIFIIRNFLAYKNNLKCFERLERKVKVSRSENIL